MERWMPGREDNVKTVYPTPNTVCRISDVTVEQIRKVFGDNSRIILLISP